MDIGRELQILIQYITSLETRAESLQKEAGKWEAAPKYEALPRLIEAVLGTRFPEVTFEENKETLRYRFQHLLAHLKSRLQFVRVILEEVQKESREIQEIEKFKELLAEWEGCLNAIEQISSLLFRKP